MPYLISNVPHFHCWVRKEFTSNHSQYHGEFLHAMVFAVNTIPDRSLSFQLVFTGCEADFEDGPDKNIHGGAMMKKKKGMARGGAKMKMKGGGMGMTKKKKSYSRGGAARRR